jgi:methanogenic corrinoid protein MtbC1
MTRYTVVWVESAKDELAEVWMSSPDREEVVAATQAIDEELAEDAPTHGRELSEGTAVAVCGTSESDIHSA